MESVVYELAMNTAVLAGLNYAGAFQKVEDALPIVSPDVSVAVASSIVGNATKYISNALYDAGVFKEAPLSRPPSSAVEAVKRVGWDALGFYALGSVGAMDRLNDVFPSNAVLATSAKQSVVLYANDLLVGTAMQTSAYKGLESRIEQIL